MAVTVTNEDGTKKEYPKGAAYRVDGHGDFVILDKDGNMIANLKRNGQDVEVS